MKNIIALSLATALAAGSTIALAPTASAATIVAADSHAAWCSQHYQSYNAFSDSYLGFDGIMHRCISPSVTGDVRTFSSVSPLVIVPATPSDNTGVDNRSNPNGQGSGTAFRLYPNDDENDNNGTSSSQLF